MLQLIKMNINCLEKTKTCLEKTKNVCELYVNILFCEEKYKTDI